MTKAENAHLDRVASLGCLICQQPAEVHHIREGQGISQRASHFLTVPLCPDHHRGSLSIHASKRQFEALYGSELDLLAQTIEKLGESE
jgi:hypothetical protein